MAFGLKTFRESGAVHLDYTDRLTRVLLVKYLGANASGNQTVTGFDPTKGAAFVTMLDNTSTGEALKAPHTISHSGSTVYWTPRSPETYFRSASWLYVVMYK